MKLFKKVSIIGTGLIGGSIGLAIRKRRLATEVIGVSRQQTNIALAKKCGAIDRGSIDLGIIKGSDLVIIATPVNTIIKLAPAISKIIDKDCIVCDVGSTKQVVVNKLSKIFRRFVGAHPLAGSEKRGVANANSALFEDSLCIITPVSGINKVDIAKINKLWVSLGARVEKMSPGQHDRIVSFVSHLPHVVAFSLIASVPDVFLKMAPNSLKEMTRIAASDAQMWHDVLLSNKSNVLNAIKLFEKNLAKIKTALKKSNSAALSGIICSAKTKREKIT